MDKLSLLQSKNPHIIIRSVHDDSFRKYGRVIEADTSAICEAVEASVPFPEAGSQYQPSLEVLENLPQVAELRKTLCGELDEQFGLCWGHSDTLNALEWHTCNEFNIAVREMVLLMAKRSDMNENSRLDAANIQAFYLAEGEMIEVYSDTLHFCPCEVTTNGFSCVVGLQRGTNEPLDGEKKGTLWAKNKWLLAHEDNTSLVQRGGYPGIYGTNWKINPIEK